MMPASLSCFEIFFCVMRIYIVSAHFPLLLLKHSPHSLGVDTSAGRNARCRYHAIAQLKVPAFFCGIRTIYFGLRLIADGCIEKRKADCKRHFYAAPFCVHIFPFGVHAPVLKIPVEVLIAVDILPQLTQWDSSRCAVRLCFNGAAG